jgi:hypothetical protein
MRQKMVKKDAILGREEHDSNRVVRHGGLKTREGRVKLGVGLSGESTRRRFEGKS